MLGKHDEARELLARAISDAEADDFVMPFAENFRYLRPLLSERPHSDFTARISELGEAMERRLKECPPRSARRADGA